MCALTLTHVPPRLGPVFAEFARVLRPGGHLIVSDVHHLRVVLGWMPRMRDASGRPGSMPALGWAFDGRALIGHRGSVGQLAMVPYGH